jgi:hypothetical protein
VTDVEAVAVGVERTVTEGRARLVGGPRGQHVADAREGVALNGAAGIGAAHVDLVDIAERDRAARAACAAARFAGRAALRNGSAAHTAFACRGTSGARRAALTRLATGRAARAAFGGGARATFGGGARAAFAGTGAASRGLAGGSARARAAHGSARAARAAARATGRLRAARARVQVVAVVAAGDHCDRRAEECVEGESSD